MVYNGFIMVCNNGYNYYKNSMTMMFMGIYIYIRRVNFMVISYPGYDELSINGVSVNAFLWGYQ